MHHVTVNNDYATNATMTFRELLDYTAEETLKWRHWFNTQPSNILELRFGDGNLATVRMLLQHIVVVERRYADRLLNDPITPYEAVALNSSEVIFEFWVDARGRLERYLAQASNDDLALRLDFPTRSAGIQTASARKIVAHALVHGVRHFAQLTTSLRQQGHRTDWFHDMLFSKALS